jgi:hypothetical protein
VQTRNARGLSISRHPLLVALLAVGGCVLESPHEPLANGPAILAVEIDPAAATVEAGASRQFAASVVGAGVVPQTVTWSIRAGSNAPPAGVIDAHGLYRVETPLASPAREYVVATSVGDGSIFGEVPVDVPALAVTIAPAAADLLLGGSISFAASIGGITDKALVWSCSIGTIDANGVYVAPQEPLSNEASITVRSTGLAGPQSIPNRLAEARVRLHLPTPFLSGASGPVRPLDTLTVFGSGFLPTSSAFLQVLFEDVSGRLGGANAFAVQQDRFLVQVPLGGPWSGRLLVDVFVSTGSFNEAVRSNMLDAGLPP